MAAFHLRYRRSIGNRFGRVNFTKTGIGYSVGVPGFRYSSHSSGRRTTTVGLPGTGLSWRKQETRTASQEVTPQESPLPFEALSDFPGSLPDVYVAEFTVQDERFIRYINNTEQLRAHFNRQDGGYALASCQTFLEDAQDLLIRSQADLLSFYVWAMDELHSDRGSGSSGEALAKAMDHAAGVWDGLNTDIRALIDAVRSHRDALLVALANSAS